MARPVFGQTQQTSLELNAEEELEGLVDSVIFASDNGQFAVFRLRPVHQNSRINVTVNAEPPLVGQQVHLKGSWITHPRFGQQFKATSIRLEAPTSVDGIERFLASGVIAGIGPSTAKRIVAKFGSDTLTIIEQKPHQLELVEGIGRKTAEKIASSYMEKAELRDVMLWLEEHQVSGIYAARIYAKYSSFSLDMLEEHPYRLAREIDGIGFATADTIAAANGVEKTDASRIAAGIDYALAQIAMSGHCCIPMGPLADRTARLLGVDREEVREVMAKQMQLKRLAVESVGGNELIYPPYLYQAEKKTAEALLYLKDKAKPLSASMSRWNWCASGKKRRDRAGGQAAGSGRRCHGMASLC
jgi:exodeoxyribonuclease V alpha subunit